MTGWSCPNESNGKCTHVPGRACDPGMKGCVLFGKFRFTTSDKNSPRRERERERLEALVEASDLLSRNRS